MKDWQQRVVDEQTELNTKVVALRSFIEGDKFDDLDEDEQDRLVAQLEVMEDYSGILVERIANFED